jgi:hypothetical protein
MSNLVSWRMQKLKRLMLPLLLAREIVRMLDSFAILIARKFECEC